MTATVTDAFTDIVADITPMTHLWCRTCYPEGLKPGQRAICGVLLLGVLNPPSSEGCEDCADVSLEHHFGHKAGG